MDQENMTDQVTATCSQKCFLNQDLTVTDQISAPLQPISHIMSSQYKQVSDSSDLIIPEDRLSNGTREVESQVELRCSGDSERLTAEDEYLALSNDGISEFPNSDLSLPEVCISTNSDRFEDDMNYEVQQAYKIFTSFLSDKHKGITSSFLHPIGHHEARHGIEGVQGRVQSQLRQSMCLRRIEEKFINQEYETITEFVADFRLMLENCYRYHGVDHWISKQAQKLEIMLEQKLTLLSRTLREKTTLAVTSKGRFGAEEEWGSGGTSTRKRQASRYFATTTVGGHESVMVQALRLEEQQRAKEEKRQRELEKKEAEEMSAKEVEEWEQNLLSQASPYTVDTLWELPAIGHFLCLAQTSLNLPEIVFFELERCLLMPRCSLLLSKIMSSLLSPPQRRATLHRRPALPYRRWESELRQRVVGWYQAVGASRDQPHRAEQLGLCHQFFSILGVVSPLEEKPFHLLPFYQRVWLLKGLCDHVYETQKDVQDAVLAQPIHECRESILGYDSKENAYIHFPHFCGADLRIYCQSPSTPPAFPFPSVLVKRVETEVGKEGEKSDVIKNEADKTDVACDGAQMKTEDCEDFGKRVTETLGVIKKEKGDEDKKRFQLWSLMKEVSESGSSNGQSCENSKLGVQLQTNSLFFTHIIEGSDVKMSLKEEFSKVEQQSKQEKVSLVSERTIKAETQDPCLNVGEHSYMGRSPASSTALGSPSKPLEVKIEAVSPSQGHQTSPCLECCKSKDGNSKSAKDMCCSATPRQTSQLSSESAQNSSEERVNDKIWTKKKKRKKKRARDQLVGVKREHKHLEHKEKLRLPQTESAKSAVQKVPASIKRKDKKKKHKTGERNEFSKKSTDEAPPVPSFKLVCSNLDKLRELISKTEDELDELESMKKRLGRWYYKKESVKELHGTLIRLLNELLPWEPKLVKAYQRNRLRLKKEFDDFKKHPEYSNFVREECVSSSSSDDDYDYEDRDLDKDRCGELEEEDDQEHVVPRGLWSGGSTREFGAESAAEERMTCAPLNNLKHPLSFKEKGVGLLPSTQGVNTNITSAETRKEFSSEPISTNPSRDSAWTTGRPANISVSPTYPVLNPTCGLPKGYTPIPTLLAKSVGNKVTLMKRPTDFPSSVDGQSKGSLVSLPTSTVPNPKVSKAQSFPSSQHQNLQQMTTQVLKQMQVFEQPGVKMAPLPKMPQAKTSQTEPKSPVQVVFKAPEGLGHLVRKDGSSQVKMSVHSVMDQKTTEKVMQQVVFLPSNFLIKKSETQSTIVNPKQSKGIQVAVSKVATPVCISTDVPCFSIPENKIPVQQVDTLKETRTGKNPNPSFPLHLQRGALNTSGLKGTQMCSIQSSTPTEGVSTSSPITTLSKVVSTETVKLTEPKQELKTVCIRDSQSILVTTRGGNTGIVKVQTSSDQNSLGSFPTSSVITISPQLKAFLVSKTLSTFSASAPSQTYPSTVPAVTSISVAQTQKHGPKFTNSTLAAVTSSIPVTSPESQTTSAAVALSHGSSISDHSTAEKLFSQPLHAVSPGPTFPDSRLKNAVVVPSPSSAGVSPALTQEFIRKTTGVKRSSADESSQATKYFLVTPPPSSSASNKPASKGTPSSTKSVTKSKVILISQPTVTSSSTFTGHLPKQVTAAGSGQGLISSLSSQKLKVGLTSAQPMVGVSSEELSKASSGTLPSGKTTSIGQTVGALSHPPSTTIPVSLSGSNFPTAAPTTGLVPLTTLINVTNCSTQLTTSSSVPTGFPLQGIPPISIIPQTSCSRSTAPSLPTGNMNKKDCGILASASSSNSPTQAITVSGGSPTQTYTPTLGPKPLYIKSSIRENTPLQSSSQLGHNKTQTTFSSAPTTSATGLVQQRIMINTSTHLTAGTQIFVNNARFVVPPHGLGPGSHMLIISGPESQVPTDTPISAGPSVAPKGASPTTVTPRATVLPQSAARLPGVPAVSSPFVACTPAVGSSLLARTPHATPFRLKGMPGLGSALTPSKTNAVSALPRFPSGHAGNFPLPPVCTSTLVSSPPAIVSSVVTNNSALVSSLAAVKIPAGTATHDKSSPTISAVSAAVPQLKGALPCSPVSPSSSAGALYSTVKPVSAPFSSAVASIVTDTAALHSSLPGQQVVVMTTLAPTKQPEQTAVRVGVPSTVQPQCLMQTGPGNSVGKQKPVLSGTRTLPAVSVSPIITTVSRTQALPIATIPPVENTVSTFETAPGGAAPPSSTFVITSQSAQPITSLTMKNAIHQPVILTNKSLGKDSVQMSALGTHASVPSRLLISPDGAVLNSVQCQLNPAEPTACPRPLDALEISPNSSSGALHPLDSTLQPPQADTKVNQKNTEPAT